MVEIISDGQKSHVPVGLFTHQVSVLVGMDMQLLVKPNTAAVHGVDVSGRLGQKVKLVGNKNERQRQCVENLDERLLGR